MPSEPATPAPPRAYGTATRVARLLAIVGGFLTVGVAALVTVSVLMRWTTDRGVNGDFEMVQIALALAVFSFLPLCQAHRGNVMVDTFTTRLPLRLQGGLDALWDLVYAAFAGFIAWRLWLGAVDSLRTHTTSMVLQIPIGYAIAACSLMAGFLCLICVLTAVARLKDAS